jgi:hypothetical protein
VSVTIKGKPWAWRGLQSLEWVRGQGLTETADLYESISPEAAQGLFENLKSSCTRVRMDREDQGGKYRIVGIRAVDDADPGSNIVDTHELISNVNQLHVTQAPRLQELLTSTQISAIQAEAAKVKKCTSAEAAVAAHTAAITAITTGTPIPYPGQSNGAAQDLLEDLIQGNTSFVQTQWVYRRTININAGYSLNVANLDCYFLTTGDMLEFEGITLPADFSLPAGEWLKRAPNLTSQYGQRTQAQYEYWHTDGVVSRIRYYEAE